VASKVRRRSGEAAENVIRGRVTQAAVQSNVWSLFPTDESGRTAKMRTQACVIRTNGGRRQMMPS
jgi:hypothetical protein